MLHILLIFSLKLLHYSLFFHLRKTLVNPDDDRKKNEYLHGRPVYWPAEQHKIIAGILRVSHGAVNSFIFDLLYLLNK